MRDTVIMVRGRWDVAGRIVRALGERCEALREWCEALGERSRRCESGARRWEGPRDTLRVLTQDIKALCAK